MVEVPSSNLGSPTKHLSLRIAGAFLYLLAPASSHRCHMLPPSTVDALTLSRKSSNGSGETAGSAQPTTPEDVSVQSSNSEHNAANRLSHDWFNKDAQKDAGPNIMSITYPRHQRL